MHRPMQLLFVLVLLGSLAGSGLAKDESNVTRVAASPLPTAGSDAAGDSDDARGTAPLPLTGERHAALSAFVTEAMTICPVPGVSVAVVQDGDVMFLEGFGTRELGSAEAVTPRTLMRTGSVTKSFTALLAAMLVDDGLVTWDTPVVQALPEFALSDPALTTRLTLADLFSAGSGLPRRDLEIIFEADAYDPEGLLAALAHLPLTASPGERYQYSNQAFTAGGYVLAAVAGASPEDLLGGYQAAMRHRVLNPLDMQRSTFSLADVLTSGDYAIPHAPDLAGNSRPLPLLTEDRFTKAVAPAGAMWSSAEDLARYLQMLLAGGIAADGERVVSEGNLERLWQPGVAVPPNPQLPAIISEGMAHYGLGWYLGEYGGQTLINHSGGTYGFAAEVAILPEANLGVAVLANDAICGALVSYGTQYRLFELVFDLEPAVATEFAAFAGTIAGQRETATALLSAVDVADVTPLLGVYTHDALGEVVLRLQGDDLILDAGEIQSRLGPVQLPVIGTIRYVPLDPPLAGAPGWITFEMGPEGQPVAVLTMTPEPGEAPLVYRMRRAVHSSESVSTPAA